MRIIRYNAMSQIDHTQHANAMHEANTTHEAYICVHHVASSWCVPGPPIDLRLRRDPGPIVLNWI